MAYDLDRFIAAQADSYAIALGELRAGRKRSHWMWWIFPQIAGLGRSETARHYAIASLGEAEAYLGHAILGPRLEDATRAAVAAAGSAEAIFGHIDAMKLKSSMTLFEAAASGTTIAGRANGDATPFRIALDRFFDGRRDAETLARL